MDFKTLNKQRKFALVASLAGILGTFLPWATLSMDTFIEKVSQSVNGFHSYGVAVFIAFVVVGIVSLVGDQVKPLDKNMFLVSLAAGAVALLFIIIFMSTIGGSGAEGIVPMKVGFGIGLWLGLLATLAILASTWLYRDPTHTIKDSVGSVMQTISAGVKQSDAPLAAPGVTSTITRPTSSGVADKIAELERLNKLKESGAISEAEYDRLKSSIL